MQYSPTANSVFDVQLLPSFISETAEWLSTKCVLLGGGYAMNSNSFSSNIKPALYAMCMNSNCIHFL